MSLNYFSDADAMIGAGVENTVINSKGVCAGMLCSEIDQSSVISSEYCSSDLPKNTFFSFDVTRHYYDVFKQELSGKSSSNPIFDVSYQFYNSDQSSCMPLGFNVNPDEETDFHSYASNSTKIMASKVYEDANLKFTSPGLEASVKQSFEKTSTITDNAYLAKMDFTNKKYTIENNMNSYTLEFQNDLDDLPNYFKNNEKQYFDFIKKYGTHFVRDVTYGGKAITTSTLENHSDVELEEFRVSAEAVITSQTNNTLTGNVTYGHTSSNTELEEKLVLDYHIVGGKTSLLSKYLKC